MALAPPRAMPGAQAKKPLTGIDLPEGGYLFTVNAVVFYIVIFLFN